MKKLMGFILMLQILLLTNIQAVFAATYTRYPPYDVGFSGGDGHIDVSGEYEYRHYINLLNGTTRLYAYVFGDVLSGAIAEAWGFMGIEWTAPTPPPPGGGGGGCPFVLTWNGTHYVLDNNLLPASEYSNGTDVTDYYKLEQNLVTNSNGMYSLLLSEFEKEHSFIDQVKLLAVDHPSNVNVAVSPYGEILTYANPHPPMSAITNEHKNVKKLLSSIDGEYYEGYNGSYVTLNFGDELDVSQGAKLVIRADMKMPVLMSIHIQVQDENGEWNTVASFVPRAYWSTEIIDITEYLPDAKGNLKVRLYFTANHKIDFVGLDTSPQATIDIQPCDFVSAIHSKDGDVKSKLLYDDDVYAELLPDKQIELGFTYPNNQNEARAFILYINGHYVQTNVDDPIVTVSSKLTLNGYAKVTAISATPGGARALYLFQIWLWVYDLTAGSYVTKTLIHEKSEEAVAWGGGIPDEKSYIWNYDQDVSSTFSAVEGHKYHIEIGIHIGVKGVATGISGFSGLVNFDTAGRHIVTQYIHLSW